MFYILNTFYVLNNLLNPQATSIIINYEYDDNNDDNNNVRKLTVLI